MVDRNDPPAFAAGDDTESAVYLTPAGFLGCDPDTSIDGDEINLNAETVVHELSITKCDSTIEIGLALQRTVQPFDANVQVRLSICARPRVD